MKLSEKLRDAAIWEEKYDDWYTESLKQWAEYAEWLEGRLEDEGIWADKDREQSEKVSSPPIGP